jgi:hypothetical protein
VRATAHHAPLWRAPPTGEFISVASQKDAEEADIAKERAEQAKGPEAQQRELEELTQIYVNRGVSPALAAQVAQELTARDVIRAHARDELGIDVDELANPLQVRVRVRVCVCVCVRVRVRVRVRVWGGACSVRRLRPPAQRTRVGCTQASHAPAF